MRFIFFAVALSAISVSSANASILETLIDFDRQKDTLVDASAGKIIDKNSNNVIDDGDIIQGLVHFNQIDGNSSYNGSIFAAYSFKVASATSSLVTLEAATGADNVRTILAGDGVDVGGLAAYDGRSGTAAFVVLENSTSGLNFEDMDGSGTDADGSDGIAGDFDNTWTAVLTAGFDGVDDAHKIFAGNVGGNAVDLTDLPAISAIGAGIQFATFGGTYTIFETGSGKLSDTDEYVTITNGLIGGDGEIVIQNGVLEGFDSDISGSNWTFQDDGNYFINPSAIPEPSTIAIWAALGLGGCGFVARRRIKAKNA